MLNSFSDVGNIHWYGDFEDLATFQRINAQLVADQGYWAMINKAAALFIEGTSHDTLLNSV